MNFKFLSFGMVLSFTMVVSFTQNGWSQETRFKPEIDGEWWTVAHNPDLGPYTSEKQQPVDFGVWQAADETWQLWSCIRHTKCGGNTRLFYRWQGDRLTDPDWKPMGIAMEADPNFGESVGGLQAPHTILIGGLYHMFYGDWNYICLQTGMDGKTFARRLQPNGKSGMFKDGTGEKHNTRDPMVLKSGDLYYCYYTAFPDRKGSVFCRTTKDFKTWSNSYQVAHGGQAGTNPYSAECPHVVYLPEAKRFYLFRTQRYGKKARTSIYCSENPLDFGVNDDRYFVCTMPVAAPEIILHKNQYYIASLLPSLHGIQIAKLKWVSIQ